VSNPTRDRIAATFDRELEASPVPPGLRSRAVHAAVAAPRQQQGQPPRVLALVAAVLAIAVIATLVIGSHLFGSSVPAGPSRPSSPPAPRSDASLVFDQAHGDLVLFGGRGDSGANGVAKPSDNETWVWDGKNWTLHHSASAPPGRISQVMAYDAAHQDVVLFGGTPMTATPAQGGPAYLNDTWTWNGSTWKAQHPAHAPTFDFSWPATMAFDPVSRTVLLFGFRESTSGNLTSMRSETWSWDGADWAQLSPSSSPGIGAMVEGGTSLLLIAGQIWRWDGSNWIGAGPPHNDATGFASGSAAYDPQRGQIVSLDGGDTWTWDGSAWTRRHPKAQPPTAGLMAYFAPLHEVISWGDISGNTNNDMWAWDGSDWNLVQRGTVTYSPPAGQLGPVSPAAAEAFIRQSVTKTSPVLLPTWLPVTMDATVDLSADYFNVRYRSDQRDKTIGFGIVVANPPPGGSHSSERRVKFRNAVAMKSVPAGYAEYFVYDTSSPTSARWLMWIEPGSMSNPQLAGPGVSYFLSATGLTDAEFWRVAKSLK
jgi:hypothetical protein